MGKAIITGGSISSAGRYGINMHGTIGQVEIDNISISGSTEMGIRTEWLNNHNPNIIISNSQIIGNGQYGFNHNSPGSVFILNTTISQHNTHALRTQDTSASITVYVDGCLFSYQTSNYAVQINYGTFIVERSTLRNNSKFNPYIIPQELLLRAWYTNCSSKGKYKKLYL